MHWGSFTHAHNLLTLLVHFLWAAVSPFVWANEHGIPESMHSQLRERL